MRRALGYALVTLLLSGCAWLRARHRAPAAVLQVEVERTADASSNERALATPLEYATSTLPDLARLESVSTSRGATLRLEFRKGDPLVLVEAVRQKLVSAASALPREAPPPVVRDVEDHGQPPLEVELSNPALSATQLRTLADGKLRQAVMQTPGVVGVDRCGGMDPTLEVEVDSQRAAAAHVGLDAIVSALQDATSTFPGHPHVPLDALDDLPLGKALHLRDVAQVRHGQRMPGCSAWDGGRRALVDEIRFGPLATKQDVEDLEVKLAQVRAGLPAGSTLEVLPAAPYRLTLRAVDGFDAHALDERLLQTGARRAVLRLSADEPEGPVHEGTLELWTDREPKLASPGVKVISVEHQGVRRGLRVDVCGADLEQLRPLAAQVGAKLGGFAELEDQPQKQLEVDRTRMLELGVQPRELDLASAAALGPVEVATAFDGPIALPVRLRSDLPLEKALVVAGPGAVPLLDVARVTLASVPARIRRVNGQRCIPSYAVPPADDPAGWIADRKQQLAAELKLPRGTLLLWSE